MNRFAVELGGIATSLLTAALIVVIERALGIRVFTWFVWLIVPVGALLCGFAAAAGYYFVALRLERRPGWTLAASMAIVGAATWFLVYVADYVTASAGGVPLRSVVSFEDFLLVSVTGARYTVHPIGVEGEEVGGFGFLIAAVQIIGFMVGAAAVYVRLRALPACEGCNRFLRRLFRTTKRFPDDASFASWQHRLDCADPASGDFASLIAQPVRRDRAVHGAVDVVCTLLGCSECGAQIVQEKSRILSGRQWQDLAAYERETAVPPGASLREAFNAAAAAG